MKDRVPYLALECVGATSDSLGSAWPLRLDSMPPHLGYSVGMSFPGDSEMPPYPPVPAMDPVVGGSVTQPGWADVKIDG